MSKKTNPARTCADCLHCQACHLWSSGAISDSAAPKCPQFKPARYASLAELQDLYRMYKGELVPVVHGRWVDNHCTACGMQPMGDELWEHLEGEPPRMEFFMTFCPSCGAKMDGGAVDG